MIYVHNRNIGSWGGRCTVTLRSLAPPNIIESYFLLKKFQVILGPSKTSMHRRTHRLQNNIVSWTGSLCTFIFSQKAELRLRTLCTFPARRALACRECADPRTQEVDKRSRLLDTCVQEESLPAESALITGTQMRAILPWVLTETNRITGRTSSSQRQL